MKPARILQSGDWQSVCGRHWGNPIAGGWACAEALEKWFNAVYLLLMTEQGTEAQDRVKAIIG
jgi:hypothetical protein